MRTFYLLPALFITFASARAKSSCDDWLKNTNAVPGHADCELICSSSSVDMGTFTCRSQCRRYCISECPLNPFWLKVLNGKPTPFKSLEGGQRQRVSAALSKLPQNFRPKSLKAIVRSTGPDPLARSNPASSSDEFIILFPIAFDPNSNLERILFHEVVHHLLLNEWKRVLSDYQKVVDWNNNGDGAPRSGGFVESDGRDSVEEDLANNVEYFIFDPEKLKIVSPKIFSWIGKNLKSKIKIEKGCNDKTDAKK